MKLAVGFFIFLTIIGQAQAVKKSPKDDVVGVIGNGAGQQIFTIVFGSYGETIMVEERRQNPPLEDENKIIDEHKSEWSVPCKAIYKNKNEWSVPFFKKKEYPLEDFIILCFQAISAVSKNSTGIRFISGTPHIPVKPKLISKL